MSQGSYEFDPCSIDGSNEIEDDEFVKIDDWKPSPKSNVFRKASNWRQEVNNQFYGYMEPGLDEIKKIRAYLRNKTRDIEIMEQFGINADTLFAIKTNRFDPVEGIINNQTDVLFKKQEILEKRIEKCRLAQKNQTENLVTDIKFIQWLNGYVDIRIAEALEGMH